LLEKLLQLLIDGFKIPRRLHRIAGRGSTYEGTPGDYKVFYNHINFEKLNKALDSGEYLLNTKATRFEVVEN